MSALAVAPIDSAAEDAVIDKALSVLERRMRHGGPMLTGPQAVRDYLRLRIADLEHEVFLVMFLDAQHRLIASEELFTARFHRPAFIHAKLRCGVEAIRSKP